MRLSDAQRAKMRLQFPAERIPGERPGRRPVPTRRLPEVALRIFNTSARGHLLPQCSLAWCRQESLREALRAQATGPREQGRLDPAESFIDATFARPRAAARAAAGPSGARV